MTEITDLLASGSASDREAVFEQLYGELKRLAQGQVARHARPAAGPTSLVHEVFLRLASHDLSTVESRGHFIAIAGRAMRQVMVDRARERAAEKRGGDAQCVDIDSPTIVDGVSFDTLLSIDRALSALEAVEPRLVRVVELLWFGGFSIEEAASLIGASESTVKRDWRRARALLAVALDPAG